MNPTLKRYIVSSITTFLTVFLSTLAIQLQSGSLNLGSLTIATILGAILTAARAGVKPVIEGIAGMTGESA